MLAAPRLLAGSRCLEEGVHGEPKEKVGEL